MRKKQQKLQYRGFLYSAPQGKPAYSIYMEIPSPTGQDLAMSIVTGSCLV